jgi:hypothetical protein
MATLRAAKRLPSSKGRAEQRRGGVAMNIRYPRLEEFDSEALQSLLPYASGPCSHKVLATRGIRENKADAGKQRSRAFAQEVAHPCRQDSDVRAD